MFGKIGDLIMVGMLLLSIPIFAQQRANLPIKTWVTPSGMTVYYVHETELPIVDIQIVFDAGSARDESAFGIAKITNEALTAGTASMNADAIASGFESVGAKYSNAVNRDMSVLALRSLSDAKFFQPALNTFKNVLSAPSFPENEFKRVQNQMLRSLEEQEESPASIAMKAFYKAIYNGSPYGHPISGTQASVEKLTANDLGNFYKKYYTCQNGLIAIVGDVDESQAHSIATDLSAHLNKGAKQPALAFKASPQRLQTQRIYFPSTQTNVLIGQLGITRNDPAYFPLMVGNYIFGGGTLTSRLFDEVREKRGLAYTVYSQFNSLKDRGPFVIELQTRNREANNAVTVVNEALNKFVIQGPTPEEIASAKKNLTQGFILRLASNSAIISQLINIGFYQLPLNYLDTYQSNISKVTDQQVKETFKRLVHPAEMVTVMVGDTVSG